MNDDEFFEAGGMNLMFAYWDLREKRERDEQERERFRRTQTVKVKFPEGVRDIQGRYEQETIYGGDDFSPRLMRLVPEDMEGWRFMETIGGDVQWHAM